MNEELPEYELLYIGAEELKNGDILTFSDGRKGMIQRLNDNGYEINYNYDRKYDS